MQIAILVRNISDFNAWCQHRSLHKANNQLYYDSCNDYHCVNNQQALTGKYFDAYIEVDYLKEDLLRRIDK